MIDFQSILKPCNVEIIRTDDNNPSSRKSILEEASRLLSQSNTGLDASELLEKFTKREQLGCTVLDETGVAIPHCKLETCKAPAAALLRAANSAEFGPDEQVELIVALVVPTNASSDHLQILKAIAQLASNRSSTSDLLRATSTDELYSKFVRLVGID